MSGGRRKSGAADPRNVGSIRLQEVVTAPAPAASGTPPGTHKAPDMQIFHGGGAVSIAVSPYAAPLLI